MDKTILSDGSPYWVRYHRDSDDVVIQWAACGPRAPRKHGSLPQDKFRAAAEILLRGSLPNVGRTTHAALQTAFDRGDGGLVVIGRRVVDAGTVLAIWAEVGWSKDEPVTVRVGEPDSASDQHGKKPFFAVRFEREDGAAFVLGTTLYPVPSVLEVSP